MPLPGLAPQNIRLPGLPEAAIPAPEVVIVQDDAPEPEMNDNDPVLRIEHDDGSVSISIDGNSLTDRPGRAKGGWFDNLVEDIDQGSLGQIADDLLRGISDDIESRREWIEGRATGIKLLGLKLEIPGLGGSADGAPVEGMSRVRHPLLLEAVLRFQANARSELLPTDGPVKIRDDGNNGSLDTDQLADALELDLNHYLTATATEYYPDTDRMLLMLGFGGTSFKKVYFCPLRGRPVSESVDADDLIVNNAATDLRNAKRITHRSMMRSSTVKRLQILGVYRDLDLPMAKEQDLDEAQREERSVQGVSAGSFRPEDRDREIYECYCELDIPGFEHKYKGKVTGLEIPYRVTIDLSSREILSIVRNFDEDDAELPEARTNFVKYTFVPGLGFYDIGLLHILGNTTNAITAAWREMLDAGMYANFPGFLYSDAGGRQNTNIFRVPPGGGALVKTGGQPIQQAIMPLPYKEPGPALMNLVSNMADTGMRIGGTSEIQVGEGRADAPVGTTLAMIDQATKVLNAVHKRMHSAQAQEFQLLVRCFQENPESFWQRNKKPAYQWDEQTFLNAINNCDLVPQADPNTASHAQRMMKIMGLKQLQQGNPSLYDPIAIDTAALQAMGWSNPQQFMVPPSTLSAKPPPEVEYAKAMVQIKKQEADAKTAMVGVKQQEAAAKAQADGGAPAGPQAPTIEDQLKIADLQLKKQELAEKQQDSMVDALNRKRDRESRERLAAVKLAEDLAANPQGLQIVQSIIPQDMLQRLESNEQPLTEE
ncbi:hypothetical protein UFOVP120_18 [uncultured Caudovirales phage]|uniref:Uncharacterized protein n=1 Tax=uncultured Caudovirales phage TaxID=2100421 RepID=A0A6J5LG34_9CAUD|nr:hypothetical protein UFOVP120_18 [uncultured Caudovirales phage]